MQVDLCPTFTQRTRSDTLAIVMAYHQRLVRTWPALANKKVETRAFRERTICTIDYWSTSPNSKAIYWQYCIYLHIDNRSLPPLNCDNDGIWIWKLVQSPSSQLLYDSFKSAPKKQLHKASATDFQIHAWMEDSWSTQRSDGDATNTRRFIHYIWRVFLPYD